MRLPVSASAASAAVLAGCGAEIHLRFRDIFRVTRPEREDLAETSAFTLIIVVSLFLSYRCFRVPDLRL